MQPDEVRWQLMIASCYRRSGNYHSALETYKVIHRSVGGMRKEIWNGISGFAFFSRKFPENVECLKFLVKLSSDMGLKEAQTYAQVLTLTNKYAKLLYVFKI